MTMIQTLDMINWSATWRERWEDLPFPITIYTRLCASVVPTQLCPHAEMTSAPQPMARESLRFANGQKVSIEMRTVVIMMTRRAPNET